jgi:hypothetical protein
MIRVKKLRSGNLSVDISFAAREELFGLICSFLELESVRMLGHKLRMKDEITDLLFYSVLNEFLKRSNFFLQENVSKRMLIKRSEATAIMWLLRDNDGEDLEMMELKGAIHKTLL